MCARIISYHYSFRYLYTHLYTIHLFISCFHSFISISFISFILTCTACVLDSVSGSPAGFLGFTRFFPWTFQLDNVFVLVCFVYLFYYLLTARATCFCWLVNRNQRYTSSSPLPSLILLSSVALSLDNEFSMELLLLLLSYYNKFLFD